MTTAQLPIGARAVVVARRIPLAVLIVLASILAGCSGGGSKATASKSTTTTLGLSRDGGTHHLPVPLLLPTRGPTGGTMDALLQGVLRSDGRCFWVGARAGAHTPVIWPHGYTARTRPLRVLDSKGHVVGRVGDTVYLGGGGGPLTRAMLAAIPPSTRQCFAARRGLAGPQSVWII